MRAGSEHAGRLITCCFEPIRLSVCSREMCWSATVLQEHQNLEQHKTVTKRRLLLTLELLYADAPLVKQFKTLTA